MAGTVFVVETPSHTFDNFEAELGSKLSPKYRSLYIKALADRSITVNVRQHQSSILKSNLGQSDFIQYVIEFSDAVVAAALIEAVKLGISKLSKGHPNTKTNI
jgi:hypothetical protein